MRTVTLQYKDLENTAQRFRAAMHMTWPGRDEIYAWMQNTWAEFDAEALARDPKAMTIPAVRKALEGRL